MPRKVRSFRIGKVRAYLRGTIWYLCYQDQGLRRRPRVGPGEEAARQLAAQTNAQLEVGAPAALSFEPITLPALRDSWLRHHEDVLRSSVRTISRYRTATDHLLRFIKQRPVRHASHFQIGHAEEFVRHLRSVPVSPNGHVNSVKRRLLDKGVCYILECCRTLFQFASKRRHLPPYAENPFSTLEIGRIPIESIKPIILFSPTQETAFFDACDQWQLPLFLTLAMTGLRLGELTHLLVEDLDLEGGNLRVRNKPKLGWQVKTRNERDVPMLPTLTAVLKWHLRGRHCGPVFRRRKWHNELVNPPGTSRAAMEVALARMTIDQVAAAGREISRRELLLCAARIWRETGAVREDHIRIEFMRLTKSIGLQDVTAPKTLRHQFATALQKGRVDPLIRNELMGHVAPGAKGAGHGLAMTAVYTHSSPETRREQLECALNDCPAVVIAQKWLAAKRIPSVPNGAEGPSLGSPAN